MTKNVVRLACAVLFLVIGFAVAAMPRSTSLARQFPELADLSETKTVVIGIQLARPLPDYAQIRRRTTKARPSKSDRRPRRYRR